MLSEIAARGVTQWVEMGPGFLLMGSSPASEMISVEIGLHKRLIFGHRVLKQETKEGETVKIGGAAGKKTCVRF